MTSQNFHTRLRNVINIAWELFIRKVAYQTLPINKEASMQLHYAYILQQLLPLICFEKDEKSYIELETGVKLNNTIKEIDLLLVGENSTGKYTIAIEMKFYKTLASSGKKRGATDLFMKEMYIDLELLENYVSQNISDLGVALVMTDMKNLVYPKSKTAKCWAYDISNNYKINNGCHLTTPMGGKNMSLKLLKSYNFQWTNHKNFYFLEMEGY